MKYVHEQNLKVLSSWTDTNVSMGLVQSLSVVQDNMCEFFKNINSDGITMVPVCNCFFVVTKTKIVFNDFIKWLDEFKIISQVSSKTKIKVNLHTDIIDKSGNLLAYCLQEMCPIDATERSLRLISTTLFPEDLEADKETPITFERMNVELDESCLVKTHAVDICNLDFYKHTNNVEYVKLMLSTMDLDFVTNNKIKDFEIHYIAESRYKDCLKIYKQQSDNNVCFEIKNADKVIVKAKLNYEKI